MGLCESADMREQARNAAVIEKQIQVDKYQEQMTIKLLLLGRWIEFWKT